jgi:hypothetical protein
MSARPLIICCVVLLAAGAAAAATTLDAIGSLETPAPRFWAPYSPQTLVVSDHDLRLVNWSAPEPRRDTLVRSLALPPIGLEAFGDSVLVRFADAEGLLGYADFNGILAFEDVPANWHLPNVQIDGVGYRVLVEPLVYLIVLSAPGPGGILGLLDFSETIGQADVWAFAGDRAVLGNDDGLHVVSLANPLLPTIMATIEPPTAGWTASGLALREHTLFVRWGDRIESYDLDNPLNPVLLDQIAATEPSLTLGGRWLVAGDPESTAPLEVFDTADPTAMSARGTLTSTLPRSDRLLVHDDQILLETAVGLNGYRIPAGTAPLVDLGYSWPLLEGTLLEMAGRTVWLQGTDRRYVV